MEVPKLVKLAQHGDEEAVFALLQLHMDKLYRIAWIYLRNEQDALEALQETSCRAFVKLGTLKRPEFFSTWIVRIMLNVCMDELKRKKRFASQDVPELAYTEENRETKYMLEQELARLDAVDIVTSRFWPDAYELTFTMDKPDLPNNNAERPIILWPDRDAAGNRILWSGGQSGTHDGISRFVMKTKDTNLVSPLTFTIVDYGYDKIVEPFEVVIPLEGIGDR